MFYNLLGPYFPIKQTKKIILIQVCIAYSIGLHVCPYQPYTLAGFDETILCSLGSCNATAPGLALKNIFLLF
jgi:hypothetical protein